MTIKSCWNYPTLLCTPPWKIEGVFPTETLLPLEPEAYTITQEGDIWRVTVKHSGEVLYEGPGPLELVESPAPF
ncbi:MAG: hypothetical protein KKB08_10805 [Gammaproteobacteria bacterium]|jgi:hypothetical protein|nr:hypothetical protein [Gammaproteobacteria bacterium]MBU1817229.1 hypothetical protein [Gammaproteobacteria bacterium]